MTAAAEEAPARATETPSPTPEPLQSTAPAAAAPPAEPPAVMQAQIQSAVAVATGSPLAVQVMTVLILLAAGFAYFRFLGGKSASFASKAGE